MKKYNKMRFYKCFIIIVLFFAIYKIKLSISSKNQEIEKTINENNNNNKNPYFRKDLTEKLLFMRHGQTQFNSDKDLLSRRTNPKYLDCKLSNIGIKQAKAKQRILNLLTLEKVYVSPFYRALQTLTYSLEKHPNKNNIIAIVTPYVSEIANCVNDYILDIKKTKKDFNMYSRIKIDWTYFEEYIRKSKYDENFYYFNNLDCFDEYDKNKTYYELKNFYDNGNIDKLKIGLTKMAELRFEKKKSFESLLNAQTRFIKFVNYIKIKHKNTLGNKKQKIFVFSHSCFMNVATNMTKYKSKKIQKFNKGYNPKNCEILSYIIRFS